MLRVNDIHAIQLVARAAGVDYVAGSDVCIAHYDSTDKLTSGVLFNNSNKYSSEIHVASFKPNWITKELLYFVFFYAYRYRRWEKLFGRVPEDELHEPALRFDLHLGFTVEAYLSDVFGPGEGLVIVGMTREQCKYLRMKPPKEIKFPTLEQTSIVPPDPTYSIELTQERLH